MLPRVLETEVMDTAEEAQDYDAMDHSMVNDLFVRDFLATGADVSEVLDVGTGTAQIPIRLGQLAPAAHVTAVDLAEHMLAKGRANVAAAGLADRIALVKVDAKRLPYADGQFSAVISNSIIHHIPEPLQALREMRRVTRAGGVLFVRDLLRPTSLAELRRLVDTYAAGANPHQRELFGASLHAALSLDEIRDLATQIGLRPDDVRATSDRHWTLSARLGAN
jgi:ubiquinone/menaquinone biosynthesis C-methylase UbiE